VRRSAGMDAPGNRRGTLLLVVTGAVLAFMAAFGGPPAHAVTFAVDTTFDEHDAKPGDGICFAPKDGPPCTLRAAVEEANALAGADRITVPGGDYHLFMGDVLTISSNLQILGASARTVTVRQLGDIDTGEGTDRVFDVQSGADATFRRLTITNGRADSRNNHFGGNIRNAGTLHLLEVTVTGGEGNSAGGVANVAGTLTIEKSTISGNGAPAEVGAGGDAGAILNVGNKGAAALMTIETSTISSNTARLVGGIFSYGNAGNRVAIRNSTIANNQSGNRGGGGGLGINEGTATLENTIVSDNMSPSDPTHPNCSAAPGAAIGSLGHNLESASECGFRSSGDIQGSDPLLGRLVNNGGQTNTHALAVGSPAIDRANDAACLAADQREFFRPQGSDCDIGAYERDQPPNTTFTSGPAGPTNDTTPTFTFVSNEPGDAKIPFECLLDAATDWIACNSPLTLGPQGQGAHTLRVRAIDISGNVDPTPATRSFTVDTTRPAAPSITASVPPSSANDNQPELKGTAEAGSTVRIYTNATCTSAVAATGTAAAFAGAGLPVNVANNTTTGFYATATDAAGNPSPCSTPAFNYREDSAAPAAPSITSSTPPSPANDNNPELKGTAEAGSTVRLYTNATCTSAVAATGTAAAFAGAGLPVTVANNTTTSFRATATDAAGNTSPCSAAFTYVEGSTLPNTSVVSGPSGPTGDATPSFAFSSTEAGATFQCRFDSAAYATCTSPHTAPAELPDGPHTFEVRARNAAGNLDPTPASRSFTVDTRAPETTILSKPPVLTTDSTPTFEFSSDEQGSTFECQLDDGPFGTCTSPFTTPTLNSGSHTFLVRAIDPSGNVDPSPALGFDTAAAMHQFTLIGSAPAPPVLGDSFNLEAASGEIFVSVPGQTAAARAHSSQAPPGYESPIKGRVFVPLEEIRQLPVGSLVDTRAGTSRLVSARNRRGRTQSGKFSAGVFQVLQSRARRAGGLTELRLKGASFSRCGSGGRASAAQLSRSTRRRLRANARGRFRTRGRHSAATVRGTVWITADRCDGTLTTVKRGKVAVRDLRRKRTVIVRAGKSYLAQAPG
jgi:CSLREA domain-containing protein